MIPCPKAKTSKTKPTAKIINPVGKEPLADKYALLFRTKGKMNKNVTPPKRSGASTGES